MKLPIPLGGTSNHFRMSALKKAGAWDPFNMTEDADLGVRLYRNGFHCRMLNSTTYEEANCRIPNWTKQRTRWLKGWLQTYFVHMRNPLALWRDLGPRGFLGFQAMVGGLIISAFAHPIFYAILIGHILEGTALSQPASTLGQQFWLIAIFNLCIGYLSAMTLGLQGLASRGLMRIGLAVLFMPLYWLLTSFAAYRALFQLIWAPFLWEKTDHGISRIAPNRHCN